jgi:hypothetical protein
METNTICNFDSVSNSYSLNFGKINLVCKKNILYYNDVECKKESLNIRISLVNLIEILTFIQKNNRYLIHIINIVYDPAPASNHYYKTLFIDNYGNVYIGISVFFDYKNPSIYPLKTTINSNIKVEYPSELFKYQLPDFIISYIKNINNNFRFQSIDYTQHIVNMITSLTTSSSNFFEFNEENKKLSQLVDEKHNLLLNLINIEIVDFREKHEQETRSLHDVIYFLENERNTYNDLVAETNKQNEFLNDHINQLKYELNLYKNSYVVYFIYNFFAMISRYIGLNKKTN